MTLPTISRTVSEPLADARGRLRELRGRRTDLMRDRDAAKSAYKERQRRHQCIEVRFA
jgi:hypothetical protein